MKPQVRTTKITETTVEPEPFSQSATSLRSVGGRGASGVLSAIPLLMRQILRPGGALQVEAFSWSKRRSRREVPFVPGPASNSLPG